MHHSTQPAVGTNASNHVKQSLFGTEVWKNKNYLKFNNPSGHSKSKKKESKRS